MISIPDRQYISVVIFVVDIIWNILSFFFFFLPVLIIPSSKCSLLKYSSLESNARKPCTIPRWPPALPANPHRRSKRDLHSPDPQWRFPPPRILDLIRSGKEKRMYMYAKKFSCCCCVASHHDCIDDVKGRATNNKKDRLVVKERKVIWWYMWWASNNYTIRCLCLLADINLMVYWINFPIVPIVVLIMR